MHCNFMDVATGNNVSVDLDQERKAKDQSTVDIDEFKVE